MTNDSVETIKKGGLVAKLIHDNDPINPRTDYDPFGTIVHWHRNYDFGDDIRSEIENGCMIECPVCEGGSLVLVPFCAKCEGSGEVESDLEGWLRASRNAVVMLPLYLYDHSGISMSVGSFVGRAQHAEWDSGQVGAIYCTEKDILENWGVKSLDATTGDGEGNQVPVMEYARKLLISEIEVYDQYLSGDCYGYTIERLRFDDGLPCTCDANEDSVEDCERHGGVEDGVEVDACWSFFGYKYALSEMEAALNREIKAEKKRLRNEKIAEKARIKAEKLEDTKVAAMMHV